MKLEWRTNVVDLLTLLTLIAGGIFGYFFVETRKLEESKANSRLANIQADVAEIEKSHKESLAFLQARLTEVSATVNISELIGDIQPNLKINLQPALQIENNILTLIWEITNIGKHTVSIDQPTILLSQDVIHSVPATETLWVEGEHYRTLSRMDIGELPPNQTTFHRWSIEILVRDSPKRIYHYSQWNTKIHPSISAVAQDVLGKYLQNEVKVDKLTSRNFGRFGWLLLD